MMALEAVLLAWICVCWQSDNLPELRLLLWSLVLLPLWSLVVLLYSLVVLLWQILLWSVLLLLERLLVVEGVDIILVHGHLSESTSACQQLGFAD
jgi:hypothetical protein